MYALQHCLSYADMPLMSQDVFKLKLCTTHATSISETGEITMDVNEPLIDSGPILSFYTDGANVATTEKYYLTCYLSWIFY